MAALLSSQIGKTEDVIKYIAEAREMGIEVLAPDVNESGWRFTVVGEKRIRFGLGAVRNVGQGAVDAILGARATEGAYRDFFDFVERVPADVEAEDLLLAREPLRLGHRRHVGQRAWARRCGG